MSVEAADQGEVTEASGQRQATPDNIVDQVEGMIAAAENRSECLRKIVQYAIKELDEKYEVEYPLLPVSMLSPESRHAFGKGAISRP